MVAMKRRAKRHKAGRNNQKAAFEPPSCFTGLQDGRGR